MKVKVLVSGDPKGGIDAVVKKLPAFDVGFIAGHVLGINEETGKLLRGEVNIPKPCYFVENGPLKDVLAIKYPHGGEICKNLTYLGSFGMKKIMGLEVAYLSGSYEPSKSRHREKTLQDDVDKLNIYDDSDIEQLTKHLKDNASFVGVDILLTCQTPKHYSRFTPEQDKELNSLEIISRLAYLTKPRYHLCTGHDLYYERLPYVNYDHKAQATHVTRLIFIGNLPQPGGKAAHKYLYAASLLPLQHMTKEQICERPESSTENPYFALFLESTRAQLYSGYAASQEVTNDTEANIFSSEVHQLTQEQKEKIEAMEKSVPLHVAGFNYLSTVDKIEEFLSRIGKYSSFYLVYGRGKNNKHKGYGFVEFEKLAHMKNALLTSGQHKLDGKSIFFNVTKGTTDIKTKMGCWFCLDNPEADRSFVCYETELMYLALDKGPIDNFHFLLVPQNHRKCYLNFSPEEKTAYNEMELKLRSFYESEKKAYIKYERYFRLSDNINHSLTHFISLPHEKFESLELLFMSNVRDLKLQFAELQPQDKLEDLIGQNQYYIYLTFYNYYSLKERRYLCVLSEALVGKMPFDFMRQFVCTILDRKDKIVWKDCVRDTETVEFLCQRMKKFLSAPPAS